jgi:hypothetical protein
MTSAVRLFLLGLFLVLLLIVGFWWYLYGSSTISCAELVPADTIAFATIPNGTDIAAGYGNSNLKAIVENPTTQPFDELVQEWVGDRNFQLAQALLPCLSGKAFIALTKFDPQHPDHPGLIAAMRPKTGLGSFNDFFNLVKTSYATELQAFTAGTGQVDGFDYQSLQAPGEPDKICIAQVRGWVVISWGEAPLGDFIERLRKKSTTPSLAESDAYKKSLIRAGDGANAFLYVNAPAFAPAITTGPATNNAGAALLAKFGSHAIAAVGVSFQYGEIVDHFSVLAPPDPHGPAAPCAFDTLRFTGTDTRFYWATSVDWKAELAAAQAGTVPLTDIAGTFLHFLITWTQGAGIDLNKNIISALGSEISIQGEWTADDAYPELGLFVKIDKPGDFKPTVTALTDTIRRTYATLAEVDEITTDNHNFATLKFVQPLPFNPTITEDSGPYFGIFLAENQAARSFARDQTTGLLHDGDFIRQIGDNRQGASQIAFLDTPNLLNQTYTAISPYVSLAAMFSPIATNWLKNNPLPPDVSWLAPVDTWSLVIIPDPEGYTGSSVSGIGNQGFYLAQLYNAFPMLADQIHRAMPTLTPVPPPPPDAAPVVPAATPMPPVTNAPAAAGTNFPAVTPPADAVKGP